MIARPSTCVESLSTYLSTFPMEAESSFKFDRRAGVHRPLQATIRFGKSEAPAAGMDICAALETNRPRKLL